MKIITALILSLMIAVSAFAQQKLTKGSAAPDFAGESLDGQQFNLSGLQGKIVVLTFWSTKCVICHSEIPKLNRMVDRYRGKEVVFLALTMENQVKVEPYLRKTPFNFSILPNSFGVVLKYADQDGKGNIDIGFPAHFVINKKGAIEMRTNGWDKAENLESQISRMLSSD